MTQRNVSMTWSHYSRPRNVRLIGSTYFYGSVASLVSAAMLVLHNSHIAFSVLALWIGLLQIGST